MRINRLMLFMLLLGYCHIGCGQEQVLVDTLNVQVYFRQGYSILEFDYRDNAKRLAAFVDSVRTLQGSASCENLPNCGNSLSGRRQRVKQTLIGKSSEEPCSLD